MNQVSGLGYTTTQPALPACLLHNKHTPHGEGAGDALLAPALLTEQVHQQQVVMIYPGHYIVYHCFSLPPPT